MSIIEENSYPVLLQAPDISAYQKGNTGIDYIHQFDSGKPGPHVMISAVVHGNELCGAIALDHLFRHEVRPMQGRLSLAFMNVEAFQSFDPERPKESRYVDEDFNRLWTKEVLEGDRASRELQRAREVWPMIEKVDLLFDIHSMQTPTLPLMMAGPLKKGRALAKQVQIPETVVTDRGHKAGRRMRDYEGFSDPKSSKNAILIECGQHWQPGSADLAIASAWRFLWKNGMVSEEQAVPFQTETVPEKQQFIEVSGPYTIQTDSFRFVEKFTGMEVIEKEGTVIGYDGSDEVKTPYDSCILIMPTLRPNPLTSAVRFGKFIESGV